MASQRQRRMARRRMVTELLATAEDWGMTPAELSADLDAIARSIRDRRRRSDFLKLMRDDADRDEDYRSDG